MDNEEEKSEHNRSQGEFAELLLDREPENSYMSMWEELLRKVKNPVENTQEGSLLLFRLGMEWLGLNTKLVEEVFETRYIHSLPSTRSRVFLGIINARGQLRLSVALHRLLEISSSAEDSTEKFTKSVQRKYRRMLSIRRGAEVWVFPVDEIHGVVSFDLSSLVNIPVTVSKSTANYLKGIWYWQDHSVGVLDEELLFESLRRLVP